MKFVALLLLVAVAKSYAQSSCSSVEPTVLSVVSSLPNTIETAIAQAYSYAADITTIGSIISTIALSSPSVTYAESVIASYEESYSSVISYIEEIYSSPSLLPPSSESSFSQLTYIHSTLASAIETIVSIEQTDYSLASIQYTLESILLTQPSILTYLTEYTAIASPSVYIATEVIAEATISSPSIVPSFIAVYTAVSSYPAVSYALSELSYSVYVVPSTVVSEVVSYINSPSVVSPSVVASLASCYASLYAEVTSITEFTKSHSTVVSAITDLIYAESTVSSLGSAIYTVISQEEPTLVYQTSVLSVVSYSFPSLYTDVEFLSTLTATSPTLGYALSTIEETFYASPSIATAIYIAIQSPSSVTNPTQIDYEEMSHQSFVSAISEVDSFESAYSSIASTISSIVCDLTSVFETQRTVLTAVSYVSAATEPSEYGASAAIDSLFSVVSTITSVLSGISYVISYSPSLSCYESDIEEDAFLYPDVVESLWVVYNSPSLITQSFSYYSGLEASYSSIASALSAIVDDEISYSSLSYLEYSFILGATEDSSLLTDESYFSYDVYSVSSAESYIQS
jgi:hypothetical protein